MNEYNNNNRGVYLNGKLVQQGSDQYNAYFDETFINDVMIRSFMMMFIAVLITAMVALYTATSGLYHVIFRNGFTLIVLCIAEFAVVIYGNKTIARNDAVMSAIMLGIYSILNGILFSSILLAYNIQSIVYVFFITSVMFGITAAFGYLTKKSLASWGTYLMMGLVGILIAMIVNMFVGSSQIDFIVSVIGVILFVGITAYDTQRIKAMAAMNVGYSMMTLGVFGALQLYMDFINLFLYLLRIFGRRD